MSQKKQNQAPIYQLKITLEGSEPPIWRRVLVPANVSLLRLHKILQVVMGWQSCHLHVFEIDGQSYSDPWEDDEMEFEDGRKALLGQVAHPSLKRFRYIYDFGDGWLHDIEIERILPSQDTANYPLCPAGLRACPPEDVGGLGAYTEFLEALRDPNHPEHQDKLDWIDGFFDPLSLDLNSIHRRLKSFRPSHGDSVKRSRYAE